MKPLESENDMEQPETTSQAVSPATSRFSEWLGRDANMKIIHLYACCLMVCATIHFSISNQRQVLVITKPIQMNSAYSSIHDCHFYNVGEPEAYSMIEMKSRFSSESETNAEPAVWGLDSWQSGKPCMHGHRYHCDRCGEEPEKAP